MKNKRIVNPKARVPDLLIGAHESIAGGIHKAFERAESTGCKTLQVFTKSHQSSET